jgi:hypothetical protein
MFAAYHLNVDELNDKTVKIIKDTYNRQREIVILPQNVFNKWERERERHNAAYTEKLRKSIKELEEGKGIVKTIAELEAMENE